MDNLIQLGRDAAIFAVEETSLGTQVYPVATDLIVASGAPDFNQVPSYTDSTEVRESRSMKARFADMTPAGSWSFPMYCRPSGTPGTAPDGAVLLKAAFGQETTYAGSSVVYAPSSSDHISMSVYFGLKEMIFCLVGATVNEFKASLSNKGAVNFNFSGQFMNLLWAGKALINAGTGSDLTLTTANDAKMFRPGMKIKIWDDSGSTFEDNTAAGYLISSVNESTGVITLSESHGVTVEADTDWVEGFLPTGTEVGDPIAARTGSCEMGDADVPIMSMDITLTNNHKYQEDEISSAGYPTSFVSDQRKIMAATNLYLRREDLDYFRKGYTQTDASTSFKLEMLAGDAVGDGSYLAIEIPYAVGTVPSLSGDLEKTMAIDFTALASSNEDEIKVTFS